MKNIIFIALTFFTFFSCAQKYSSFDEMATAMADETVPVLKVNQVKELLASGKNVVFIDARELEEYNTSHLEKAIWVGYDNLQKEKIKKLDRNKTYVIYCSVGYRSGKVGKKMSEIGFKHVFNLYGGLFDWINKGNPVYNAKGKVNKVHPYNDSWGKWLNEEYRAKTK